jgi:hypothetical protein
MNKLLLFLLLFTNVLIAQPEPRNNCNPACFTPNPPWWCDCNPVPLDTYQYVLMFAGILLVVYYYHFNKKLKTT